MMCLSNLPLCKKLTQMLRSQIETDYKLSLSLYTDETAETPECAQTCEGRSRHSLATLLSFIGVIAAACALMRGVCALIAKLFSV